MVDVAMVAEDMQRVYAYRIITKHVEKNYQM